MSGNVWEWTRSQYGDYPYPESEEGRGQRERFEPDAARVLRGGVFAFHAGHLRCSARVDYAPAARFVLVGFRVVLSPSGL